MAGSIRWGEKLEDKLLDICDSCDEDDTYEILKMLILMVIVFQLKFMMQFFFVLN